MFLAIRCSFNHHGIYLFLIRTAASSSSEALILIGYVFSSRSALIVRPARVLVLPMGLIRTARLTSGLPRQFSVIGKIILRQILSEFFWFDGCKVLIFLHARPEKGL
jgi:hypothetical protein